MPGERPIYITQDLMNRWVDQSKVVLNGSRLNIPAQKREYELVSAIRFLNVVSGDDTYGLIGKIRTPEQLAAINAEIYMDSCLIGDVAYEVEEGFLGHLVGAPPPEISASKPSVQVVAAPPRPETHDALPMTSDAREQQKQVEQNGDDLAALTDFLLKNL